MRIKICSHLPITSLQILCRSTGVKHIHTICCLLVLNGNSKYNALQNGTPFLKHGTSVSTLLDCQKTLHRTVPVVAPVVLARSWHRSTQRHGPLVFISDLISSMVVAKLYSCMAFLGGPVTQFVLTVQIHDNRSNRITKKWAEREHTRLRH